MTTLASALAAFGIDFDKATVYPIHQGLINNTWKVDANGDAYIVQKVNDKVFRQPEDISHNIDLISAYLKKNEPDYYFVDPLRTVADSKSYFKIDGVYYRVFPFVKNSFTKSTVGSPDEAYEAAKQFGKFSSALKGLDSKQLKITIPRFHDLNLRQKQFELAVKTADQQRLNDASSLLNELSTKSWILDVFNKIQQDANVRLRVMHHDTKISNILFDKHDKGICVIDLDTVMPGYFISDVGDMMRTYLSPVSEEEKNVELITVRPDFYEAIQEGYLSEMDSVLTYTEKKYFFFSGLFMIYMQSLRFVTDYLNNDSYYGAAYPQHNLYRALNQFTLLNKLEQLKEQQTSSYVFSAAGS